MKITLDKAPKGYSTEGEYRYVTWADMDPKVLQWILTADGKRAIPANSAHIGESRILLTPLPKKKRIRITLEEVDTFEEATPYSFDSSLHAYIDSRDKDVLLCYQPERLFSPGERWVKIIREEVEE